MKRSLFVRHLVIPFFFVERYTGWHPWYLLLIIAMSAAWIIVTYNSRRNWGWLIVGLGGFANFACMAVNGGYMPVRGVITQTEHQHTPLRPEHRLVWLADNYAGASIGDFIVTAGLLLVLAVWFYRKRPDNSPCN